MSLLSDLFDQYGTEDNESDRDVECRFCGKAGLTWIEEDNLKWILMTEHGEVHKCKQRQQPVDLTGSLKL